MAGRRENGQGSVFRHRDGWAAQLTITTYGQPRRRKTVYGTTQREVLTKLDTLRRSLETGIPISSGRTLTVGAYLEQWISETLPSQVAGGRLRTSTLHSYAAQIRLHITPTLGRIPLDQLGPREIRLWLAAKQQQTSRRGRPLSPRTCAYLHGILRAALADACRDELLARNAATLVRPPRPRTPAVTPLSIGEARTILTATAGDPLYALWVLLLGVGLRRGEALALHWDDLHLDPTLISPEDAPRRSGVNQLDNAAAASVGAMPTVRISRSLQRLAGPLDPATGRQRTQLAEVDPKTVASTATLPLPEPVAAALRAHRREQLRARLAAPGWHNPDLVFATPLGTHLEPRNVSRQWVELCERLGMRHIRLHDLRHSAASFLLLQGVDLKLVQTTLRHSRLATTADLYTHVHPELQDHAAQRMAQLLAPLTAQ